MAEAGLFRSIELPYCQALMFERWDAAPGRYFVAWRARGAYTALLGSGVVDEFRTISGPILLAPSSALGGIYDAGMRLADARDAELPIDQGWPPLTIGIDVAAPARPDDWIAQFLGAIQEQKSIGEPPWQHASRTVPAGSTNCKICVAACVAARPPASWSPTRRCYRNNCNDWPIPVPPPSRSP